MWIVSDGIIAAALVALIVLYLRGNHAGLVIGCIVCYCCLPAVRLGEAGINSAYVVTALLAVLFVRECTARRVQLHRGQVIYLGLMFLILLIMAVGWMVNGRPRVGDVVHFAGLSQYILGVFFLSVWMQTLREKTSPERLIMTALPIVLGINAVFVLLQFISYPLSSWLLRLLYAYPGKTGPLDDIDQIVGYFHRLFGANYTPLLLAVIGLLFCAFLLGRSLREGQLKPSYVGWFFASLSLGLLAFSKTVILGIVVLLVCAVALAALKGIAWLHLRRNGRVLGAFALSTVVVFSLVACLGFATGRGGQVKYYYGFLLSPLNALSTRYEDIGTPSTPAPDPGKPSDTPEEPPTGNMASAFDVFLEHKLIGVGPAAVNGEFLGDSQFILVLHDGGLLAFGLYALLYLWLLVSAIRAKDAARALIVLALAIGCLSIPVLSYACTIPFVAYCLAVPNGDLLFDKKREV